VLRRSAGSLLLQPPAAGAGAGELAGVVDTKGCAIRAKRLVLSAEYLPASATTEATRPAAVRVQASRRSASISSPKRLMELASSESAAWSP
jgi:hypothetical protein